MKNVKKEETMKPTRAGTGKGAAAGKSPATGKGAAGEKESEARSAQAETAAHPEAAFPAAPAIAPDGDASPVLGAAPAKVEIRLPVKHNPILKKVIERVNADEELYALWTVMNVNAVDRLGMTDHGPVHFQIVSNIALKMLRQLVEAGVVPGAVKDLKLSVDDAEVIVVMASLLHDLGMSIQRQDHEELSLFVAQPKINALLEGLYAPGPLAMVRSEILHAIISHRSDGRPATLEAGIVRVADALDMTAGRSRIPFEAGVVNIHSVSAASIEKIEILAGKDKPIHIEVEMSNSAGVYQLDELLKRKLKGSGLEQYVEVQATIEGLAEKKLVTIFKL